MKTSIKPVIADSIVAAATGPEALFYFPYVPDQSVKQLVERVRQGTRSLEVRVAPGHPRALFLSYQPQLVDLKDIRQDLKRGGFNAALITC